jgi:branched-chain amino acid transport system substrate-binding protein
MTRAINRRMLLAGGALLVAPVPLRAVRAQSGKFKLGILMPRSGVQAQLGIDAQRGADLALEVLPPLGYPQCEMMLGDTESNVQIARSQAEKLIEQGCHMIMGCFDSGSTVAAAQVCEQRGVPLLVNIASVPSLTEQGFKTVFRNFPTGPMVAADAFLLQKELFEVGGSAPKSCVVLHANDTFGTSQRDATTALIGRFAMPYTISESIGYDPAARDLSAEVRRAKASNAELVWCMSRLNDSVLIVREMVKQRWQPMGILNTGPGTNEDPFMQTLGKLAEDFISVVPWYDPTKNMAKFMIESWAKKFPGRNVTMGVTSTFEASLIALDAMKRAGAPEPARLIEALRATDISDNVSVGPGVKFNEKGQNAGTRSSLLQNRDGKPLAVIPAAAADAKPIWPMRAWDQR